MDIRSIISTNSPAPAQARPVKQARQQPDRTFQNTFEIPPTPRNAQGGTRPPPPPPLQPPSQPQSHIELPSPSLSSYASAQSPYQQTPSSTLSGGQYPFPQAPNHSPGHGFKPSPYAQQEGHTGLAGGYGPSPSLPSTPLTIAPENPHPYPHQQRQNSIQSLTTPTSAQSQLSSFSKMSPQTLQSQVRALSQSHSTQQYHSQPGTPLGPPPSYVRPTPNIHKEQSGSFEHHRSHSGSSHGYQQVLATSPRTDPPGAPADSPREYESRRPQHNIHHFPNSGDRERTLSVSPKTKLPAQPHGKHVPVPLQTTQTWDAQVIPAKRKLGEETSGDRGVYQTTKERVFHDPVRSRSLAVNGMLNASPVNDRDKELKGEHSPTKQNTASLPPIAKPEPSPNSGGFVQQEPYQFSTPGPPTETQQGHRPSTLHSQGYVKSPPSQIRQSPPMPLNVAPAPASPTVSQKSTTQRLSGHYSAGAVISTNPLQPPVKKKQRPTEVPIYAQSSRSGSRFAGANPTSRLNHFSAGKPAASAKEGPGNPTNVAALISSQLAISATGKQEAKYEMNGSAPPGNLNPLPKALPTSAEQGPLGSWEPSIVNVFPFEELTRVVSDFLFNEVVRRDDVGAGPAGGGVGMGAVLEIEAKLGQLIDKETNERLRLPVMSECVLSPHDPGLKTAFKSSMTEAQHRSLNVFLNNAFGNSQTSKAQPGLVQPADRPRVPMSYVHTFESDSFFELSQTGVLSLPASISRQLNPPHRKAKVRVTIDKKTGKEIARIIKVRVADLDVYSPCTAFDWRVSVNIEMNIDGDSRASIAPSSMDGKRPERNKDRMSYKHLAYQIDLTQVKPSEAMSKAEKEHELEIEVSSAEVRKQGLLAKDGLPNDYEKLIKGFVDNVRLLARQCQQ